MDSKCKTCDYRIICNGVNQFMCKSGDYKDYVPESNVIDLGLKKLKEKEG